MPWHALDAEVSGSAIMTPFLRARSTGKVACNCFFTAQRKIFLVFGSLKSVGRVTGRFGFRSWFSLFFRVLVPDLQRQGRSFYSHVMYAKVARP